MPGPKSFPQATARIQALLPPGAMHHVVAATVSETIRPGHLGRVKFQGTWWFARCEQNIVLPVGTNVYLIDRENLTLIVEPVVE
ncbi:MAG: NfeD family protein [Leptolyngbyaceae cyanobacterium HOT.MB2.61]|jgi:membrane-bound ClpP family serine protease|nr:NfeD family protein [Leptolyngbyaceae cyanobacterium HOT.MB2.61]